VVESLVIRMRFLGIDFGWQGKPSGLAVVDWDGKSLTLAGTQRLDSVEEVLEWVDAETRDRNALVAVDAPTIIKNAQGMRTVDRLMHRNFGKYHAGAYPANLGRPYAANTTRLGEELLQRKFAHADQIAHRKPGRFQIEVYPHAAIVELFDLPRIIKYKKGVIARRFEELTRYRNLILTRMPGLRPPLAISALPSFELSGPRMKIAEDQLDAVICAYIGAHWWFWGNEGNLVCGSVKEGGYIVVPCREYVLRGKTNNGV
jgi:predicted RNase H-like nuclease